MLICRAQEKSFFGNIIDDIEQKAYLNSHITVY